MVTQNFCCGTVKKPRAKANFARHKFVTLTIAQCYTMLNMYAECIAKWSTEKRNLLCIQIFRTMLAKRLLLTWFFFKHAVLHDCYTVRL